MDSPDRYYMCMLCKVPFFNNTSICPKCENQGELIQIKDKIGQDDDPPSFRYSLEKLINSKSMENASNTPDFILAGFLEDCLHAFDKATQARTLWYGPNDKEIDKSNADLSAIAKELPEY